MSICVNEFDVHRQRLARYQTLVEYVDRAVLHIGNPLEVSEDPHPI